MMKVMRSMATNWVAKILIALLVMSFAVWGVSDVFRGFGANEVARVGGTEVSIRQFEVAYSQSVQQLSQQFGQPVSNQQAQAFGVPGRVLGRLLTDATLTQQAKNFSLGLSDDELARSISDDPLFRQSAGGFNRSFFQQILRSNGLTEDQYVTDRKSLAERAQLVSSLTGELNAPLSLIKALDAYNRETRTIRYVELASSMAGEIADPSDTALATYYDGVKSDYDAPEYRSFSYLRIEPSVLADPSAVTDEEAQQQYQATIASYTKAGKRGVDQLRFDNLDAAREASQRLKNGASFDDELKTAGKASADVSLGVLSRSDFADNLVANAAFSLGFNEVSDVVEGRFGSVILRITEVREEIVTPFSDVSDAIKNKVSESRASEEVLDLYDKIEDERAGGATLKLIANSLNLPYVEIRLIDARGELKSGDNAPQMPIQTQLLDAVYASEQGLENDPLDLNQQGFLWYDVSAVELTHTRELADVRETVAIAWKGSETSRIITELATDYVKQLNAGGTLDILADKDGLSISSSQPFTRTSGASGLASSVIAETFNGTVNSALSAVDGSKHIVLVITSSDTPLFDEKQAGRSIQAASVGLQNDMLSQFIVAMQDDLGVNVNQAALTYILGGDANQPGQQNYR